MKTFFYLFCVALVSGCAFGQAQLGPHPWAATIKVVGDDGQPMEGANVSVSYSLTLAESQNKGQDWDEIKGLTDNAGTFSASHTDRSWNLGIDINKADYYRTYISYPLYVPGQLDTKTVAENRNPTMTLVLKKIGKPTAMYVKSVNLGVPVFDKPIAFDLMIGDWLAPYGKGINTDIVFTAHNEKRSEFDWDYKLVVSFPNSGDGIQQFSVPDAEKGSALHSLHEAPTNNYQPQWVQTMACRPHIGGYSGNRDENRNYYFRVRTKLDENGNVVSALYGKIYGDFMQFRYYLNPTPNSRNIEFDPKQNLFKAKKSRDSTNFAP